MNQNQLFDMEPHDPLHPAWRFFLNFAEEFIQMCMLLGGSLLIYYMPTQARAIGIAVLTVPILMVVRYQVKFEPSYTMRPMLSAAGKIIGWITPVLLAGVFLVEPMPDGRLEIIFAYVIGYFIANAGMGLIMNRRNASTLAEKNQARYDALSRDIENLSNEGMSKRTD